jgi:hypothetical protein
LGGGFAAPVAVNFAVGRHGPAGVGSLCHPWAKRFRPWASKETFLANPWGIPRQVEEAVLQRDERCVYCGCEFGSERATKRSWEHIINDVNIATMENIALCCIGCNASKGAKPLRQWLDSPGAKRRGISENSLAPVVLDALKQL